MPAEVLVADTSLKVGNESSKDSCWHVERLDLSHLAGESIELSLTAETEATDGEPRTVLAEPLWIRPREPSRYNVILISIDTLRADRLGSYGYLRNTSPKVDEFAASGVRFATAISQAPWTLPSHASLFTSRYPTGLGFNPNTIDSEGQPAVNVHARILADVPTLAEVLRENGYRTSAITSGGAVAAEFGLSRGFDVYHEGPRDLDDAVWKGLTQWLDAYESVPFFLFFHTYEVHAPYLRHDMNGEILSEEDGARLRALVEADRSLLRKGEYLKRLDLYRKEVVSELYDSGIRHTDAFLANLFAELQRRDLYDQTLIVLTSDHGEEFGEHTQRFYNAHGNSLYEELIRVPLIFRMPEVLEAGVVVDQPVELIDVAPTILELLGASVPTTMVGQSLVGLMRGSESSVDGWAMSESLLRPQQEWKSVRNRQYKYISVFDLAPGTSRVGLPGAPSRELLFALEQDPGEQRSLHKERPDLLRSMRRQLIDTFHAIEPASLLESEGGVSPDLEAQLRALGYVD